MPELRASAARCRVVAGRSIEVAPQHRVVDGRRAPEDRGHGVGAHEAAVLGRHEFTDRNTRADHDERFSAIESTNDLVGAIAKLSHGYLASHANLTLIVTEPTTRGGPRRRRVRAAGPRPPSRSSR